MQTWGSPHLAAHAAYLRHLAAAPASEAIEEDGVYAVRTRVLSNAENGVLSDDRACIGAELVQRLVGWFAEWQVPASWLCAEGPGRREAAATLEAAGCRPERSAYEMRASLRSLELESRAIAGTRIEAVASAASLDAWLDVAGACGWFESVTERQATRELQLGLGLAGDAPLRLYLALRDEAPVGMASAFSTDETVLLVCGAVLSSARRQGIGRALALARLVEARNRGCRSAVLAPSPDGAKLYHALGFETHRQPPDRWFYLPAGSVGR